MTGNEANEEQGLPQTRHKRVGSDPSSVTLEQTRPKGQMMRRVTEEDNDLPEDNVFPDLPPLPSQPDPPIAQSQLSTEDPPVYDTIEDVETVLKVTEPFRKVQYRRHNK